MNYLLKFNLAPETDTYLCSNKYFLNMFYSMCFFYN